MAKNDMEIIMYKILKYFYECMKNDINVDLEIYGWESKLFSIPKNYWCKIIEILTEKNLIRGFVIKNTKDGIVIQADYPIEITYDGREFLRDNSSMQKAKTFCGETFEVLLSSIIGVIIQ